MIEKGPKPSGMLSDGAKLGIYVLSALALFGQVAKDQIDRPDKPKVEFYNPVSWVATPISALIDHAEHTILNDFNSMTQNHSGTQDLPDKASVQK